MGRHYHNDDDPLDRLEAEASAAAFKGFMKQGAVVVATSLAVSLIGVVSQGMRVAFALVAVPMLNTNLRQMLAIAVIALYATRHGFIVGKHRERRKHVDTRDMPASGFPYGPWGFLISIVMNGIASYPVALWANFYWALATFVFLMAAPVACWWILNWIAPKTKAMAGFDKGEPRTWEV